MKKKLLILSLAITIISMLILTIIPLSLYAAPKSYNESYDEPDGTYPWNCPGGCNITKVYMELYCWECEHVDWSGTFTDNGYVDFDYFDGSINGIGTPDVTIICDEGEENDLFTLNVTYYCNGGSKSDSKAEPEPEPWVRDQEMTCYQVWINEDHKFEFVFWWEYANNNWVKIYDMDGVEVFSIDMPYGAANFEADLPDGMYTVKTFHEYGHVLQEFMIGKP
ncbi:MAG: T9SS type A sorting domain-containing protein [Actinobacteria bacterium]|nr:T9SS type A sorting domain-containing protein [Actinomycetota bacterium]